MNANCYINAITVYKCAYVFVCAYVYVCVLGARWEILITQADLDKTINNTIKPQLELSSSSLKWSTLKSKKYLFSGDTSSQS